MLFLSDNQEWIIERALSMYIGNVEEQAKDQPREIKEVVEKNLFQARLLQSYLEQKILKRKHQNYENTAK